VAEQRSRRATTGAIQRGTELLVDTVRNLGPIVAVIAAFQLLVIREPIPDLARTLEGLLAVAAGLALFIRGLRLALFPLGESMASLLARKGSVVWLLLFGFLLGFGTTVAEPALIAVAGEAADARDAAGGGGLEGEAYALALRYTVALAVGCAIALGVIRIVRGWPIQWLILTGYALVVVITPFAPREVVGVAYDAGGVTTSTITVPLVAALGVGLSMSIKGRSPMIDGFGLIALASLFPILFVLGFGMVTG
jgi:hypothetical protein